MAEVKSVLFIADGYFPKVTGGTVVLGRLADEMARRGVKVTVYAPLLLEGEKAHEEVDGVEVFRGVVKASEKRQLHPILLLKKKIRSLKIPEAIEPYENDRRFMEPFFESLLFLIDEKKPDIVVSVCFPFYAHMLARKARRKRNFRWYAYYLDPFYGNEQYHVKRRGLLKMLEIRLIRKADRVLMPRFIAPEYRIRKAIAKKLFFADHPFIDSIEYPSKKKMPSQATDCLYVGTFYADIRDPSYLFSFFEAAEGIGELNLCCVGRKGYFPDGYFEGWEMRMNGRLRLTDVLPHEEVKRMIADADLLVNIGNTNKNQMPSKIVEYINTGKPILHFYKTENCPARQLLEGYPLAFCVDERAPIDKKIVEAFGRFLVKARGEQVEKETILARYADYTVEHVADQFLK